jgi:Protein of unknown function, DUF547
MRSSTRFSRRLVTPLLLTLVAASAAPARAAAPDLSAWGGLLGRYYDPAHGMKYGALKAREAATLAEIRRRLATVDVASLSRPDQLAYWINLYNVSVVSIVVDRYPVASIRDLSTDPIVRLNVFKKPTVQVKGGALSLNDVENAKIREGFKDPRIHFAINCAAKSCPPLRTEPYAGARIGEQLDDQARRFLDGPTGVHLEKDGDTLLVHTTKIMGWFGKDFERWSGGQLAFLRAHLPAAEAKRIDDAGGKVKIEYDGYDWKLNDWK